MNLDEARQHIGAGVVYRSHPDGLREDGTIVRVNDRYVFVQYLGSNCPMATRPEDLTRWPRAEDGGTDVRLSVLVLCVVALAGVLVWLAVGAR